VNSQRTEKKYSFILVVGLILGLFFLSGYLERVGELLSAQAQVTAFQQDIDSAKQWNLQLKDDLVYYASPEYVSEIARSELGYVQPGDDVFVVLDAGATRSQEVAVSESSESEASSGAIEAALSPLDARWWYGLFR
jgi:cell division protein FtsB